jgi:PAS domain S-box-containing protein
VLAILGGIVLFATITTGFARAGDAPPFEELHTAEQIRRLTPEQAALHYPVKMRGVITVFDQSLYTRFLQDDTAGIYIGDNTNLPPLKPGQEIQIEGVTYPGEYAPILMPSQIEVVGTNELPAAKPVTYEQLTSGQEDSQFVEVHGVVRAAYFDEQTNHELIDIATGGGRLTAYAQGLAPDKLTDIVGSMVRARGVCISLFNRQRQLFRLRLLLPRPQDLVVEGPSAGDPFSLPLKSIGTLQQFTPEGSYGSRVKVVGTVIYRQDDSTLYIEDEKQGVHVQTQQAGPLLIGDRVEVVGFPAKGIYTPMMEDAIFRKVSTGHVPKPENITVDEALKGTYDCRLVRIEATVLERVRQTREQFLVLQADGIIFNAAIEGKETGTGFSYLQKGSKVAVTGVCLIEPGNDWHAGEDWRAKSFHVLMRTAGDVFVLKYPPWWTLQKMLWMVAVLCFVVLFAMIWVVLLRNRVASQTDIISQKLQTEAALKARYEELFENANDFVYTHDLQGGITSINQTGEQLLQRSRAEVLNRNIVDLVVEEQRTSARKWLDEVLKGAETPAAEWDFVAASGHRVKLEVSTRLIKQQGAGVEVEGIARDITERKRLEREILEISNREQRRIGHDLHDGICQLLAGIALMSESLANVLDEKGVAEFSEAERISELINSAIMQTRGVARGLFPVRLEENGLPSALEELASNVSELFKINCVFVSEKPPSGVDNEIALHLYYIVLEAVANAVKHGKARHIVIKLEPVGDRYLLEVREDGSGFVTPPVPHSGMGIRIMQYRARVIGATLNLENRPGHGTHLTCLFSTAMPDLARSEKKSTV